MYKLNTELARRIYEKLQIGNIAPNYSIGIKRKKGNCQYEDFMFNMRNASSITLDRRFTLNCDSMNIVFENIGGQLSPDYATWKKYNKIDKLPQSGYRNVIDPFNEIIVNLGYGDELRRMFTGEIDSINIQESPATISIDCRNKMKRLKKPIDPILKRSLVYKDQAALKILKDLFQKAGVNTYAIDFTTIGDKDFTINKAEFEIGMEYMEAISTILDTLNHRIYADRFGNIIVEKRTVNTQKSFHVFEVSDYVNMTQGNYAIDSSVIRNRVIIQSQNSWKAYEDPFLIDYCNGEIISSGLEVPWADTDEQKLAVADSYFMEMRRKLRRINVGIIGNPTLDVGDLVKMEALVSTAVAKYVITGISTNFNSGGYVDVLDLEFVTDGAHVAVEARGDYSSTGDGTTNASNVVVSKRDEIVAYAMKFLGVLYQYGGNYISNSNDYGMDSSNFVYTVYNHFGLINELLSPKDLYESLDEITEAELLKGDLVFYTNQNDVINHVCIYVGDNKVISSFDGDETVVKEGIAKLKSAGVKIHDLKYKATNMFFGRIRGV